MKRVLLIEDDEAIRLPFGEILRRGGYDVVTAADGRQGMVLFNEQVIDLVITDLFMPKQDGAETITAIRRLDPEFKIIAISGGGQIVRPEYLEPIVASLGVKHFLKKPFTGSEFLKVVSEVLCGSPLSPGSSVSSEDPS
jgi:CheY-like chemotaxis protein